MQHHVPSLQAHKKPKMEKEAEAELITANAPPPKTGEHATATAAAPMAEASTAAHSQLDAAAPAAQPVAQPATAPPAVAPAPEAAAPALPAQALQALPPPEPRWPVQTTPLFLACRYFDRDLAGYIEAADLEEILVMVSNGVSRVLRSHICCAAHLYPVGHEGSALTACVYPKAAAAMVCRTAHSMPCIP